MRPVPQIDYYFSVLSPFTYLAGDGLERVARAHGVAIDYKPFNILKVFAEVGTQPPGQRHWSRQEYRLQDLARLGRAAGLPINVQPAHWPTDFTPASEALIAASAAGFDIGDAARRILAAVWAEERDIAQPEIVRAALEAGGVRFSAIEPHLPAAAAQFAKNTDDAIAAGVFGAPFYIVGAERFWGQDRLPHLDAHLGDVAASDGGGA